MPLLHDNPSTSSIPQYQQWAHEGSTTPSFLDEETRTHRVSAACLEMPIPHVRTVWKTSPGLSWFNSRVTSFLKLCGVSSGHIVPSTDCTWWYWCAYDLSNNQLPFRNKNWVFLTSCPVIAAKSLVCAKRWTSVNYDLKLFWMISVTGALYAMPSVSRLTCWLAIQKIIAVVPWYYSIKFHLKNYRRKINLSFNLSIETKAEFVKDIFDYEIWDFFPMG